MRIAVRACVCAAVLSACYSLGDREPVSAHGVGGYRMRTVGFDDDCAPASGEPWAYSFRTGPLDGAFVPIDSQDPEDWARLAASLGCRSVSSVTEPGVQSVQNARFRKTVYCCPRPSIEHPALAQPQPGPTLPVGAASAQIRLVDDGPVSPSSPARPMLSAPPASLDAEHAAEYEIVVRSSGAETVILRLDGGEPKVLKNLPAVLKLGELGPLGPGAHVLVAYAVDDRDRLFRPTESETAIVRFQVERTAESPY